MNPRTVLATIARTILETPWGFFGRIRLLLFLRQCNRDLVLVKKVAEELELPVLVGEDSRLRPKDGQTLFILGGGKSVNDLTEADFATIESGTSIGINYWPIHDFVPSILASESDQSADADPYLNERLRTDRILSHPPTVLSLRTNWPVREAALQHFPKRLNRRRYIYGRANVITRKERNLGVDLNRILGALIKGRIPEGILPDNGSTVARMTFWGVLQGFSRIVWVGVDHDSGPYFWTDPAAGKKYERAAKVVPRSTGIPHSTSSAENRPFSNDIFLPALYRAIKNTTGVKVYVGSERSALSSLIPVFDWP